MSGYEFDTRPNFKCLVDTIAANMNNEKLSDAEFRQFVRNSVPKPYQTPDFDDDPHDTN